MDGACRRNEEKAEGIYRVRQANFLFYMNILWWENRGKETTGKTKTWVGG
jgi:hypothetical protein